MVLHLNVPARLIAAGLLAAAFLGLVEASGPVVIAGYGPERPLLERLAHAFEKANPGSAVTLTWDRTLRAADLVRSGKADLAVSGEPVRDLEALPIAWDGIAVIVNFANPVTELTTAQLAQLFTGGIRRWSELGGADEKPELIVRPADRNVTAGFEQALNIVGRISPAARTVRSDQKVLNAVSGRRSAVTYMSLGAALEAVRYGISVRILVVDRVEAGEPTVKDGRYKIKRPVLLLTPKNPGRVAAAFTTFARSPEGQRIVDELFIPYAAD